MARQLILFLLFPMKFIPDTLRKRMKKTDPIGPQGEELAADYLNRFGYKIIERNYRRRFGEIDIIAKEEETIVFVEVKTRRSTRFGTPFEAVDLRKQRQLSRVALDYLTRHDLLERPARFDIIAVLMEHEQKPRFEVIKNAFDLYGA
jgi:putative endonuclease